MHGYFGDDAVAGRWLKRFFVILAGLAGLGLALALPAAGIWLYQSGDLAAARAAEAQQQGFALYGPGLSRSGTDDLAYKLELYRARKPQVAAAGSAGLSPLRDDVFSRPMVNMCGTADSLSSLRRSLDAMLAVHTPEVVLLAVDFWWFSTAWEADPFARGGEAPSLPGLSPRALRMPVEDLVKGDISLPQFLFMDFRDDRYGTRAQFHDAGWGPDGSWHMGDALELRSADAGFRRTLDRVRRQIGEFAPQSALSPAHLDAFADIYFRLRGRGVTPMVCIAPLAGPVLDAMKERAADYPHLYGLRRELEARGIPVMDTSDPRYIDGSACEFIDGVHGGEVTAVRLLRDLCSNWNGLLAFVDMEKVNRLLTEWKGHAAVRQPHDGDRWETDFLALGGRRRSRCRVVPAFVSEWAAPHRLGCGGPSVLRNSAVDGGVGIFLSVPADVRNQAFFLSKSTRAIISRSSLPVLVRACSSPSGQIVTSPGPTSTSTPLSQ